MKILVVDDDLVLSDVIAFTLRRAGYETVMADNSISALEVWKAAAPSIVILDWQMPLMDGIAVC
ncbi:MAG: response regulator, partial [Anaerolineae bacterium]|nr:response regulator [Anaerolineae bacterium]